MLLIETFAGKIKYALDIIPYNMKYEGVNHAILLIPSLFIQRDHFVKRSPLSRYK